MNSQFHSLPRKLFDALAAGGGGPEAIDVLAAAERSKHFILLRGVLEAAQSADPRQARFAQHGQDVLAAVERTCPDAVARTARYPAVGAWAVHTLRTVRGDAGALKAAPARLSAIAAAAAVQSGLDVEVPVLPESGLVSLPSLGVAKVDADTAVVRSFAGRSEVRWAHGHVDIPPDIHLDAPGWQGLRKVSAGNFKIVIDDLDPFRMPAVIGTAPRLSSPEGDRWEEILLRGWQMLAADHPAEAAESAAAISAIVPLASSVHGQLSSTSPETFGAVAMSEPPDACTCAVTLLHELQHLKLCALLDIVNLTRPDNGRRYYAPWRTDPRPIAGLLQGAYAYLGVTSFWQVQRQLAIGQSQLRADSEFALWRMGVPRVIDTLFSSDQLTATGLKFVQRMSRTASTWRSEPISAEARAIALQKSRHHLTRWKQNNGPIPV